MITIQKIQNSTLKFIMNFKKKLIKIRDSIDLDLQNHTKKIKDTLIRSVN